mmetsp:Transcript_2208/g.8642  ORF Transcript_2208/g.8642 Transcript_2208/m.8642 type:complete len:226 (-) Transcript_2208:529-1206(-)
MPPCSCLLPSSMAGTLPTAGELLQRSFAADATGDLAQAIELCQRAVQLGNAEAMATLGVHYLVGRGVLADACRAAGWFHKAAQLGDVMGQSNLAVLLLHGIGIEKDEASARRWAEVAAQAGDKAAQYNLAQLYSLGLGGAPDKDLARTWFSVAASQGHVEAIAALAALGESLADGAATDGRRNGSAEQIVQQREDVDINLSSVVAAANPTHQTSDFRHLDYEAVD